MACFDCILGDLCYISPKIIQTKKVFVMKFIAYYLLDPENHEWYWCRVNVDKDTLDKGDLPVLETSWRRIAVKALPQIVSTLSKEMLKSGRVYVIKAVKNPKTVQLFSNFKFAAAPVSRKRKATFDGASTNAMTLSKADIHSAKFLPVVPKRSCNDRAEQVRHSDSKKQILSDLKDGLGFFLAQPSANFNGVILMMLSVLCKNFFLPLCVPMLSEARILPEDEAAAIKDLLYKIRTRCLLKIAPNMQSLRNLEAVLLFCETVVAIFGRINRSQIHNRSFGGIITPLINMRWLQDFLANPSDERLIIQGRAFYSHLFEFLPFLNIADFMEITDHLQTLLLLLGDVDGTDILSPALVKQFNTMFLAKTAELSEPNGQTIVQYSISGARHAIFEAAVHGRDFVLRQQTIDLLQQENASIFNAK